MDDGAGAGGGSVCLWRKKSGLKRAIFVHVDFCHCAAGHWVMRYNREEEIDTNQSLYLVRLVVLKQRK